MNLKADSITKSFGGLTALRDVCLEAPEGCITGIAGPNGAGKTTLFNVMSGFTKPDAGKVHIGKRRIDGRPPWRVARSGVGRLFQDVRPFGKLTTTENVLVAIQNRTSKLSPASAQRQEARQWIDKIGLADKAAVRAEELSFGQQKLLALARLFAAHARVILLDEPTAGIDIHLVDTVLNLIRKFTQSGAAVIIIEHELNVLRSIARCTYFLTNGEVLCSGPTVEVLDKPEVRQAFLGGNLK